MVRLVHGVACCAPIGMQHATTGGVRATRLATGPQHGESRPYERMGSTAQRPAQQARNRDATAGAGILGRVLRAGGHAMAFRRWRVTTPAGAAMEVLFTPDATVMEVAELYPGATIEPLPESPARAFSPAEDGSGHL